jgi:predicted dehydrogenase
MTRRIGIAVIGLGPASEPHAKSLIDLADRVDVRWAATRSAARLASFAARTPFPATTDIVRAITDPAVDAVLVLTPPAAHLEISMQAFSAGKHVLVEKPLELTVARAEALVAAGRAAGKKLGVVLQQRFRAGGQKLRALMESGRFGTVEAASMHVPWWRPQSYYDEPGRGTRARDGGGVLLTQAIHTLNMFQSLVGVRRVIAAQARTTALHRMETEDYASALIELGNGAPGTILATTAMAPGLPECIEIIFSHGSAVMEGAAMRARFLDGTEVRHDSDEGTGGGGNIMDFPHDAHRDLIADFLDAIEQDRDPRVTGEDALATQRLVEEILAKGRG